MLKKHFYIFFALNLASICLGCLKANPSGSSINSATEKTPFINGSCPYGYSLIEGQCEECGLSDFDQNVKIVGGVEAVPHSIPSQIFLTQSYSANSMSIQYACGGTLIRPNVVLTAAHCINTVFDISDTESIPYTPNSEYPTLESTFDVYAGLHDTSTINSATGGVSSPAVRVKVSKIITHQSFDLNTMLNDITLLILAKNLTLNSYIKVACLPKDSSSYPPEDASVWASGWGTLSSGGNAPYELYNVKLTNYDSSKCSTVSTGAPKNWNNQLCAGEYAGGKDTCQGDSGGPIMYKETVNGNVKMFVSGITSYGDECALTGKPGIYTRVSAYTSWILANI